MSNIIPAAPGYTALIINDDRSGYVPYPVIAWERNTGRSMWPVVPGALVDDDAPFDGLILPDGKVYDLIDTCLCDSIDDWCGAHKLYLKPGPSGGEDRVN